LKFHKVGVLLIGSALHWLLQRYYTKSEIAAEQEYPDDILDISNKIMNKYVNHYIDDNFKIIDAELPFTFKRKEITWNGKIDLLIEKDSKLYIMDHKYSSRAFVRKFYGS